MSKTLKQRKYYAWQYEDTFPKKRTQTGNHVKPDSIIYHPVQYLYLQEDGNIKHVATQNFFPVVNRFKVHLLTPDVYNILKSLSPERVLCYVGVDQKAVPLLLEHLNKDVREMWNSPSNITLVS